MNDAESGRKLKVLVGFSLLRRLIVLKLPLVKQFSRISVRDWTLILMHVCADVLCGIFMCEIVV